MAGKKFLQRQTQRKEFHAEEGSHFVIKTVYSTITRPHYQVVKTVVCTGKPSTTNRFLRSHCIFWKSCCTNPYINSEDKPSPVTGQHPDLAESTSEIEWPCCLNARQSTAQTIAIWRTLSEQALGCKGFIQDLGADINGNNWESLSLYRPTKRRKITE